MPDDRIEIRLIVDGLVLARAIQRAAVHGMTRDEFVKRMVKSVNAGELEFYDSPAKREHRPMFERFTERARQVVVMAQEEARALRHERIGTEHLLLGLLREEEGLAAHVLRDLGVALDNARRKVDELVEGTEGDPPTRLPFTEMGQRVLELALREALSLGHNYIGTEHILLGLVRDPQAGGLRVLRDADINSEMVRNEIIRVLAERRTARPATVALELSVAQAEWVRNAAAREPHGNEIAGDVYRVAGEALSGARRGTTA
jgi:hypothetical protein